MERLATNDNGQGQERKGKGKVVSDKQRIQFDFTAEAMQRLDSLLNKTGSATKAEVLKKALRLLEWLVMELDPDQIIVIEDSEGKAIYRIPVRTLIS